MTDHAQLVEKLRKRLINPNPAYSWDDEDTEILVLFSYIDALVKERDEANANAHLFLDRLIIGDKAMGEGDTVATFFAMKARAEAAEAEIERLRKGGCARDQKTTQWCAEAVQAIERAEAAEAEVVRLREALGDIDAVAAALRKVAE